MPRQYVHDGTYSASKRLLSLRFAPLFDGLHMPTPPIRTSLISMLFDSRTTLAYLARSRAPCTITVPYHSTLEYLGYRHRILVL